MRKISALIKRSVYVIPLTLFSACIGLSNAPDEYSLSDALIALSGTGNISPDIVSGNGTTAGLPNNGTVRFKLTDAPRKNDEIKGVYVTFDRIEVHSETRGWLVVENYGDAGRTFELLALRDGKTTDLGAFELAPGRYTQIRLILKEGQNKVLVETGGTRSFETLTVPSGIKTGIKIVRPFTVSRMGTVSMTIDFDAEQSIHYNQGQGYMLKPVIRILDFKESPGLVKEIDSGKDDSLVIIGNVKVELPAGSLPPGTSAALAPVYSPPSGSFVIPATFTAYEFLTNGTELAAPVAMTIHYDDADLAAPAQDESQLEIFRYDPEQRMWISSGGVIDPTRKTITADITAPGLYAVGTHAQQILVSFRHDAPHIDWLDPTAVRGYLAGLAIDSLRRITSNETLDALRLNLPQMNPALSATDIENMARRMGGTYVLVFSNRRQAYMQDALARLAADPAVNTVSIDSYLELQQTPPPTNEPRYSDQWGLPRIGMPVAWNRATGDRIVVGVMDSGVDCSNPDLANRCIGGADCRLTNAPTNPTLNVPDTNGHGTHVAGIIAASSNGNDVVGVAHQARIMPLGILGNGPNTQSRATCALNFAMARGVRIVNGSWHYLGGFRDTVFESAPKDARLANVLYVAAAANDNQNLDVTPDYPASYPLDNIIAVGSTTESDTRSSFSNFGVNSVDIAAPGDRILSTWIAPTYAPQYLWGTSMAAPHVAGAVALILSQARHRLSYAGLRDTLLRTSTHIAALDGLIAGGRRLNVDQATLDASNNQTMAWYRWYHETVYDHFYTGDPTGELAPGIGYKP